MCLIVCVHNTVPKCLSMCVEALITRCKRLSPNPNSAPSLCLVALPHASYQQGQFGYARPGTGTRSAAVRLPLASTRRRPLPIRSADSGAEPSVKPAITLSAKAFSHLNKMREDLNQDLCLRIGVRQGGCSGMSYAMDFEQRTNVRSDDSLIDYEGFTMVCDPKSLLYLYGMQLDYSDALIGGGFSFSNPNATSTCGCGKSFAA